MKYRIVSLFLLFALSALPMGGCAKVFVIAEHPFIIAEVPENLPKQPLRVALVQTEAMAEIPTSFGGRDDFDRRLARSVMQGLADAGSLVVEQFDRVDEIPTTGYDLVCLPSNPYFESRRDRRYKYIITMTLEVTVLELSTGNKRGMLLEASGIAEKRPAVPIRISTPDREQTFTAGVTGALVYGGYFEQALNNALFYLSLSFAEKLQKRGARYMRDLAESP